jgi:hypothetical protein
MKKRFLFLAISLCNVLFAAPLKDHIIDPQALYALAQALDIPPDSDLIAETQKQWLRKPGKERWEVAELSEDKRAIVLNWATQQGLFDSWKPLLKNYDKALILGATTSRMQMRLNYLIELWEEGTRFDEIVWLTGDRPLDPRVDSLTDRSTTESGAARIIWEETILPEGMRNLPVVFMPVPMKIEGSSSVRPNTQDTLVAWQAKVLGPCTALFVSNQPFCGYQFAVIKTTLTPEVMFDLVGSGVDLTERSVSAAVTLDSIARWIYQDDQSIKK